jgi:hypothetical protein
MRLALLSLLAMMELPAQYVSNPRIDYATYLGAIRVTPPIAVDKGGYAYVVGTTGGGCDIAKINPSGSAVTCINVPSAAPLVSIALDRSDEIYVVGNNVTGAIVAKLSPDGSQVRYSTAIAGATAAAVAVDSAENAFIAGTADSTFITTAGAYLRQLPVGASTALFALKLSETGAIVYATYGGYGVPNSIAIDSQGQLWIAGISPVTIDGGPTPIYGGPYFAFTGFVEKLDAAGAAVLFSSGFGAGQASGVAISSAA